MRKFSFLPGLPLAFAACVLAGCSTYSSFRERNPVYVPTPGCGDPLAQAQAAIVKAGRCERRTPLVSLGGYISAARLSLAACGRNPKDMRARSDYNFAVGRMIEVIRDAELAPWSQPLTVPTGAGPCLLTYKPDTRAYWNPALYTFTPADRFDLKGDYVSSRTVRPGIGAPVVAVGKEKDRNYRTNSSRSACTTV